MEKASIWKLGIFWSSHAYHMYYAIYEKIFILIDLEFKG